MQPLNLKPAHKLVKNYDQALAQFGQPNIIEAKDAYRW
jgi:hypothetical protein